MWEANYKKPFLIAAASNAILIILIAWALSQNLLEPKVSPKDVPIQIDMAQFKAQGNDPTKPLGAAAGGRAAGDPNLPYAGPSSVKQGGDGKAAPKSDQNYLGGSTSASAGVVPNGTGGDGHGLGQGDGSGTGGGHGGDNTMGDGSGSGTGPSGDGTNGGNGYVDIDGYVARLNSMKSYPPQALNQGITGTVYCAVSFTASGEVVGVSIAGSSGSGILDKAAQKLIWNGGNITNTTGQEGTITVPIVYGLE